MTQNHDEITAIREEIAERYNMVFPDVVLEPLWWGRRPENRCEGRFAIVDQNTDAVFNVCTDMYQPIYHELVIKDVEDVAASMQEFGKPEITVKLLADGGKLKVNVKFPEVEHEIKTGDKINPQADIFSSYDLGWKYGMKFGAYRLVCSNGLTVGEVFESYKKRHLVSLDANILHKSLTDGMSRYSEQTSLWSRWAEQKVLPEVYDNMWEALPFSAPEKEKIENMKLMGSGIYLPAALKSGELTRWEFYNALTQYATHEIKSELRQVEIGPQITRVFER